MNKKLYIGNLSFTAEEEELKKLFGSDGRQVVSVSILIDKMTGRSRGFGFAEMASHEDALKAVDALHGHDFMGRPLTVNEARDMPPREGGAGPRPGFGRTSSGPRPNMGGSPGATTPTPGGGSGIPRPNSETGASSAPRPPRPAFGGGDRGNGGGYAGGGNQGRYSQDPVAPPEGGGGGRHKANRGERERGDRNRGRRGGFGD